MVGQKGLSVIRSRLDTLLDDIKDSTEDINEYIGEIGKLLVESEERL